MRRFYSIAMIVLLVSSAVSPVWAATTCDGMGMRMMCHRSSTMRHCDMVEGQEDGTASEEGASVMMEPAAPNKCPMQCCMQATGQDTAALPKFAFSLVSVSYRDGGFFSTVFSNAGFSSHTDRGPPAL